MELSYFYTIKVFSTAQNYKEKRIFLLKYVFFSYCYYNLHPSNNSRQLIFNINVVVLIVVIC